MQNIVLNDVLVLEKENYVKNDKGEFCMCSLWIGQPPLKYTRTNLPLAIYDKVKTGSRFNFLVDYRFFNNQCTGIKVIDIV